MIVFPTLPVVFYKTKFFSLLLSSGLTHFFSKKQNITLLPSHTLYLRLLLTFCGWGGTPDPALMPRGQARHQTQNFRATSTAQPHQESLP